MPELHKDGYDDKAMAIADSALASLRMGRTARALALVCHLLSASNLAVATTRMATGPLRALPWIEFAVGVTTIPMAVSIIALARPSKNGEPMLHAHQSAVAKYAAVILVLATINAMLGLRR